MFSCSPHGVHQHSVCGNTLVHDTLQATHSCSSQFSTHTSVVPHAQLHRTSEPRALERRRSAREASEREMMSQRARETTATRSLSRGLRRVKFGCAPRFRLSAPPEGSCDRLCQQRLGRKGDRQRQGDGAERGGTGLEGPTLLLVSNNQQRPRAELRDSCAAVSGSFDGRTRRRRLYVVHHLRAGGLHVGVSS